MKTKVIMSLFLMTAVGCGSGVHDDAISDDEAAATSKNNLAANFDLQSFGIDDSGNPYVRVAGTAGGSIPAPGSNDIYAYVLVTDTGIFAVASHEIEDSSEVGSDLAWHAHLVMLDGNNCITDL